VWRASFHKIRLPRNRLHWLCGPDGQFDFPADRNEQVKADIIVLMHAANRTRL
jgi:hypothetical protein